MLRAASTVLLSLYSLTAMSFAGDDFGDFRFPEIGSDIEFIETTPKKAQTQSAPIPAASTPGGRLTNANPTPLPPVVLPQHNSYPSHAALQSPMHFTSGPSNPSPLLAYMQCSTDACPNVWAGFAAQHQADMSAFCSGCSHGSCGCGQCGHGGHCSHCGHANCYGEACQTCSSPKPIINRYRTQSNCDTCDGP